MRYLPDRFGKFGLKSLAGYGNREKEMQTLRQLARANANSIFEPRRFRSSLWFGLGLATVFAGSLLTPASAQFPPCPPPAANEYLLLVRSDTEAERTRVQDLLPSNSTVMVCDYLEDTVVRAGGFTNLENANAWAQYMTEVEGFQAFVARPAANTSSASSPSNGPTLEPSNSSETAATTAQPTPQAATTAAFAPQPLGPGFAVLVDYQYDPETAVAIQNQVGQAVGLAVHKQRAYLLIAYSPDVEGAASTLDVLSSYGISSFIVDSREVVMLAPAIALGNE
jgi:hypothetical protein